MKTLHRFPSIALSAVLFLAFAGTLSAKKLNLPLRSADALSGSAFAKRVSALPLKEREEAVWKEAMAGNVPEFLRELVPVTVSETTEGRANTIVYYVTPDYLAIGANDDYFPMPLTPFTAQKIADQLGCSLPTPKMVNQIYSNALVKLTPSPMTPGAAMVTMPAFIEHNETVRKQRAETLAKFPLGSLTAGHKKDVVISNKLLAGVGKVAIYGWHKPDGLPIQPVYTGHTAAWADYSHGIRLVDSEVKVNGKTSTLEKVLGDAAFASLLSNEGPMKQPRYVLTEFPEEKGKIPVKAGTNAVAIASKGSFPNETVKEMKFEPEVRIQINAPATLDPKKKLLLIFFTLPNGNTIEQSVGKELKAGDDWHFNIQHIGAQTRFLREKLPDQNIVVAYLESGLKSWPAWRKKHGDADLPKVIELVKSQFKGFETSIVLSGHSGGGSFIFGYLNTQEKIPAEIERIAFLDSNYAYDSALHHAKFTAWLKASDRHALQILAYHDDIALLDGKTFVSAAGGTWGKSHAMLADFEKDFSLEKKVAGNLEKDSALNGRLQFLLLENPEKKIFHTVQVEKNGFIQVMLAATPLEEKDYQYFGERAYWKFIGKE